MSELLLASVVSVGGTGLELRIDGEENARIKKYKCLASYIPKTGHRVLVAQISGTYLVVDRVVDAPVTSLTADDALKLNGKAEANLSVKQADRALHVQNQNSTSEGSDIYFRVGSNKLNFRVGTGGTWYVITSA